MDPQAKPERSMKWLPIDMLTSILLRLPAKTLVKFLLVCKQWHATIYPTLSNEYRSQAPKGSICVVQRKYSTIDASSKELCDVRLTLYEPCSVPSDDGMLTIRRTMSISDPVPQYHLLSSACNGLFCFSDGTNYVVVCNPTTGEFLTLPSPDLKQAERLTSAAIGYSPHTSTYKVLVSIINDPYRNDVQCKVFTLGSDSWRIVSDAPCMLSGGCVAVCGEIYWWTHKDFVVSFDVKDEKFGLISPPKELDGCQQDFCAGFTSNIVEMDGRLGLMQLMDHETKVIWILKDGKRHEWKRASSFCNDMSTLFGAAWAIQDEKILYTAMSDIVFSYDIREKHRVVFGEECLQDHCLGEPGPQLSEALVPVLGREAYFHVENLVILKNIGKGFCEPSPFVFSIFK